MATLRKRTSSSRTSRSTISTSTKNIRFLMENSIYYNTKAISFITILNRILVAFVVLVTILIFALDINDTVSFKEGLIFSDTPQLKVTAPNDVKIVSVLVKEGQEVRKGDTLFRLENKKTQSEHDVLTADITAMENKIAIITKLMENTEERKKALRQLLGIQSVIYKTDRKKAAEEIQAWNNKLKLSSQQSSILSDKYKTDSLLYAKGAISRYEMTSTKSVSLNDRKADQDIRSGYTTKSYDYQNLANNNKRTRNDLKRSIIDVDNDIENYKREILELQTAIKDGKSNLTYISDELGKMVIVSPYNGTISNLFNAKQNQQLVEKGELLAIVAPEKEKFYAKVTLDEKDLAYIKNGQDINLKLDAYNYYRYGAVKGRITYVSPSDVNQKFYCLARINHYNPKVNLKAGYKLKGEVIIEQMVVYQYIMKKLFDKIES
ncbi:MAG: HlyD family efflux transporter periplasmic adaptor subunit [Flavobacterium sp.]|nr:MAG: HlyD family efflux transporter periplasmic adaptor subunit [Flavobacterium sp.]